MRAGWKLFVDGEFIPPPESAAKEVRSKHETENTESARLSTPSEGDPRADRVKFDKLKNNDFAMLSKKCKKEVKSMSINIQQKVQRALDAKPRLHKGVFEKRATINGTNIYACATTIKACENKFFAAMVEFITHSSTEAKSSKKKKSISFADWSETWFEEVFRSSVIPLTFEREKKLFERHVLPYFRKKQLKEITPLDCVKYFNELKKKDIERTAESCYNYLNRIFKFAIENDLITKNPMSGIKPIKHERENGAPLTFEEEKQFLARIRGNKFEAIFLVALYTGIRPCEYETARLEGDFIVAQNRKQKNQKKYVEKKIPITPMLEPYREFLEKNLKEAIGRLTRNTYNVEFKKIMPNHRPYDLRDTFATRCQECGVIEQAVQVFMGHVPKTLLGKVYTKFSDKFLLSEGKKVRY